MSNRRETDQLNQRGDITGPPEQEQNSFPIRPQHVSIQQKPARVPRGRQ
ncbi:hypothetical protein [Bacillus sp. T33-2]|nr:hypothetical protein [Bacillus sp. T33-2]